MLFIMWGPVFRNLKALAKITWKRPIEALIDALNFYHDILKAQSRGGVVAITFPRTTTYPYAKTGHDTVYTNFIKNQDLAEQFFSDKA